MQSPGVWRTSRRQRCGWFWSITGPMVWKHDVIHETGST